MQDIEQHNKEYEELEETERDSIVKSRIGQGLFRERLIDLWKGCSVSGLSNLNLLKASHIKPWRDCNNSERLNPLNGLLIHPTLDHLFDMGFITFDAKGMIRVSRLLSKSDLEVLNIEKKLKLKKIPIGLMKYMEFHRNNVFKDSQP